MLSAAIRRGTTEHVLLPAAGVSGMEVIVGARTCTLRVSSPFMNTDIFRSFYRAREYEDARPAGYMVSGIPLSKVFGSVCNLTAPFTWKHDGGFLPRPLGILHRPCAGGPNAQEPQCFASEWARRPLCSHLGATVRRALPHAAPLQDARKLLVASYITSAYPVMANEDRPGAGKKPLTQALIGKCDVKQTSCPFLSGSLGFAHHACLL